jgi:hypothetical protein
MPVLGGDVYMYEVNIFMSCIRDYAVYVSCT